MADDEREVSDEAVDAGRLAELEEREKRADAALRAGKAADAVKITLESPPFASKNAALKERSVASVLKALVVLGQKDADVAPFIESLDGDQADILMKFIYAGLKKADNSGLLLKVHAQLTEKRGLGAYSDVVCAAYEAPVPAAAGISLRLSRLVPFCRLHCSCHHGPQDSECGRVRGLHTVRSAAAPATLVSESVTLTPAARIGVEDALRPDPAVEASAAVAVLLRANSGRAVPQMMGRNGVRCKAAASC
jgi:actin related protein 2/3 complex subunit 5